MITVTSAADEINALRSSLDSLEQLVSLEHRYIQRMQERDRLYRLVLDSTRDLVICFDQQGLVSEVNQAAVSILGCTELELTSKRVHQLRLQKRVADSWELCRRAAMKPDALIQHEVQGVFPDGNTYVLQTFFYPIDDGRGNITGAIMIGRNTADHSPGQQQSLQAATLDHVLYQEFAGIAYRGDLGQRFSTLFGCVQEITGYLPSELSELNWESLVHPDDRASLLAAYEMLQSSPELTLDQEYRILTKHGQWKFVREVVRSLPSSSSTLVAAEGIITDISDRKLAEQSMHQLAGLLRSILTADSCPVQVLVPGEVEFDQEAQLVVGEGAVICYQQLGLSQPCQQCAALRADSLRQSESCRVQAGDRVFECTAHPILDERGRAKAILTYLADVTSRVCRMEQAEAEASRLATLLDAVPQAVLLIDQDHQIRYMNHSLQAAVGDHIGQACHHLRGLNEPCAGCPLESIFDGEAVEAVYTLHSYGREFTGQARRHSGSNGELSVLLSLTDVTEARMTERQLEYYQALAKRQRDIVVVSDLDGNILEANEAARELYGHTQEELLRLKLNDLGDMAVVLRASSLGEKQRGIVFESVHRRSDGGVFPVEVSAQCASVSGQEVVLCLIRDISVQQEKLQAATFASQHDALTGLFNRSYLDRVTDWLGQERNYPISVVMGDVNGLKLANDAFGYAVGDELIKAVARAITENLRASDIAIRFGGDEFVLFLPATTAMETSVVCERIEQQAAAISHAFVVPSIAWGIATATNPGPALSALMKQAEERMQRCKQLDSDKTRVEMIATLHQRLQRQAYETAQHTDLMQQIALGLGQLLGLSEDELHRLSQLALLHDLGKVAIPESILQKPEDLTKDEWLLVQRHSETGYRIARTIPELAAISDEILTHHERWDGTGYPKRLRGEEIPLLCRIIAIADAYAVMITGRPYRTALSHSAAAAELVRCAGTQFDPQLVRLFVNHQGLAGVAVAGEDG